MAQNELWACQPTETKVQKNNTSKKRQGGQERHKQRVRQGREIRQVVKKPEI
jgi:hypothetical protein